MSKRLPVARGLLTIDSIFHFACTAGFLCFVACLTSGTLACPFCSAVKPTLSQQRDAATAVFLGECTAVDAKHQPPQATFSVRKWIKGTAPAGGGDTITVSLADEIKPGTLAIVLGSEAISNEATGKETASGEAKRATAQASEKLRWQSVPLTELGFAYAARLPEARVPPAERLAFFARFLESSDPLVADDAFLEFGYVPYDLAAPAVKKLPADKLRGWIADPKTPPERKGFYGLALGLTAAGAERAANLELIRQLAKPNPTAGADFRAGFDGVLGGLLVALGPEAVKYIQDYYLADTSAAIGDVRQAHRALRFYFEFGPSADRPAVAAAVEQLLARPSEAALAITDLARWKDWVCLARVADLYTDKNYADPADRTAVVGYLTACPNAQAAAALAHLKEIDPAGVAKAQQTLKALGGKQ
ncbi:MAG TPA: hypothetical protein VGJ15_01965 [Pirellulales bacterium]|jgi:hypothetical protein